MSCGRGQKAGFLGARPLARRRCKPNMGPSMGWDAIKAGRVCTRGCLHGGSVSGSVSKEGDRDRVTGPATLRSWAERNRAR